MESLSGGESGGVILPKDPDKDKESLTTRKGEYGENLTERKGEYLITERGNLNLKEREGNYTISNLSKNVDIFDTMDYMDTLDISTILNKNLKRKIDVNEFVFIKKCKESRKDLTRTYTIIPDCESLEYSLNYQRQIISDEITLLISKKKEGVKILVCVKSFATIAFLAYKEWSAGARFDL